MPAKPSPEQSIPLLEQLPTVPVAPGQFVKYVKQHPEVPVRTLLAPFLDYESALRAYFAQKPDHAFVQGEVNLISLFSDKSAPTIKVRARDVKNESQEEKDKYLMPLDDDARWPDGAPALVQSLEEFRENWNIFTEGTLANLDWSNVVAAGSSVQTPLMKLPEMYAKSKADMRKYYHDTIARASDIDLFLYGIDDPKKAIAKMEAIEATIKDNLLCDSTSIRTRNTITIVSQYPHRHVQIVLRLYKSISQILTGFDVNCSCFAYDGTRILANPRAVAACMTQCNDIDLTRRSPSFENRLSKYSHKGFEVYCSFLDRSKIDPTIYEQSFSRTVGLARLLVLEALPKPGDREQYENKRRSEMGRPEKPTPYVWRSKKVDLKQGATDGLPEWSFEADSQSNYLKFAISYGPDFTAKRLKKLFFQRDLLLNSEWNPKNRPPHRTVDLHRHPVFFGKVSDIVHDCCGFCPEPLNDEDREVMEKEDAIYVKGEITFLKDDPGRQEIGSFYPLGPEEWTDMAYVGSTGKLCQAIVDNDINYVKAWCQQGDVDINHRDHCGRTPLQLAAMNISTDIEIVQTLIDHGARLISRMQDGRTALHLAASQGRADMITALLKKSAENEHKRDLREQKKNKAKVLETVDLDVLGGEAGSSDAGEAGSDSESYDAMSDAKSKSQAPTVTTDSFVKVEKNNASEEADEDPLDDDTEIDDIIDINIADWDYGMTPLHHAIIAGEEDATKTLVSEFGADPRIPVKVWRHMLRKGRSEPLNAILSPVLALTLEDDKIESMMRLLLELGASSAQTNFADRCNLLHYVASNKEKGAELLEAIFEIDGPTAMNIINSIGDTGSDIGETPLMLSLLDNAQAAKLLLSKGASGKITVEAYMSSRKGKKQESPLGWLFDFNMHSVQPIEAAIEHGVEPEIIRSLIAAGADPSSVTHKTRSKMYYTEELPATGETILDHLRKIIRRCRRVLAAELDPPQPSVIFGDEVLDAFPNESYVRHRAEHFLREENERRKEHNKELPDKYEEDKKAKLERQDHARSKLPVYLEIERILLENGAKTYYELAPAKDETVEAKRSLLAENKRVRKAKEASHEEKRKKDEKKLEENGKIFDPPVPFVEEDKYRYMGGPEKLNLAQYTVLALAIGSSEPPSCVRDFPEKLSKKVLETAGLIRLFEACWRGLPEDEEMVRALASGQAIIGDHRIPPIEVSKMDGAHRYDNYKLGAISYAGMRGNHRMIEVILEIAQDQYKDPNKEDKDKMEYTIDVDDSDGNFVIEETTSVDFTLEHSETVPKDKEAVESTTPPFDMLVGSSFSGYRHLITDDSPQTYGTFGITCFMSYAIVKDDMMLIQLLLRLADQYEENGAWKLVRVEKTAEQFSFAFKLGRIHMLEYLMETITFGIPYSRLEKKDEEHQKARPKYYEGLTVDGRKRGDWVNRSFPAYSNTGDSLRKPIQAATVCGNLESIKWLLSDRPLICLRNFLAKHPSSRHARLLQKQGDNLEALLKDGLGIETSLLPFLALKRTPSSRCLDVFRFLVSMPGALEVRTNLGMNLGLFAIFSGEVDMVPELQKEEYKIDWLARDQLGRNVVHFSLVQDEDTLKRRLECLPKDVLEIGFSQRTYGTLQTPLASLLATYGRDTKIPVSTIKCVLGYSGGVDLGIPDCMGNLPVHTALQNGHIEAAKIMLDTMPETVHIENANGRTPLDIALSQHLLRITTHPPRAKQIRTITYGETRLKIEYGYNAFDEEQTLLYRYTRKISASNPRKRKLVSLSEASRLAERLAKRAVLDAANDDDDDDSEGSQKSEKSEPESEYSGGDILSLW